MILPITWLKEYVKVKSTATDLAEALTMQAAEIEEIMNVPQPVQEAYVAQITKIDQHPNADRLHLVTVQIRDKSHTVVCGAQNISVGDIVPFIPLKGSYCDEDGSIKELGRATIRGISSSGMLGSERDLGLSDKHEGIMVLPQSALKYKRLRQALQMLDPVLKLEITPNRSDLFSVIGLAREVAFIEKTHVSFPHIGTFSNYESHTRIKPTVTSPHCSRYCVMTLDHIVNRPSPDWLANRLRQVEIQPQNAIVDITNYVMFEYGQPLHAFDFDLLTAPSDLDQPKSLQIRTAKKQEHFLALDGETYLLNEHDTVIADDKGVIALAGVIGGDRARITDKTTQIVLESAIFDPGMTRKSANRYGLRTESLTRFEKGIDPEIQIVALKRAASLITEICDAKPIGRVYDYSAGHEKPPTISVSLERVRQLVGMTIEKQFAKSALSSLGFTVTSTSQFGLRVTPPSWRLDVTLEEDVIEELVRLIGYENVPSTLPQGALRELAELRNEYQLERKLRSLCTANGYTNIISQPFVNEYEVETFHLTDQLQEINNPTSKNERYLRPSLTPLLLNRLAKESVNQATLHSFEIGHVFSQDKSKLRENPHLSLAVLCTTPVEAVRAMKGLLTIMGDVTESAIDVSFQTSSKTPDHLRAPAENVLIDNQLVGTVGIVTTELQNKLKLRGKRYLVVAEIDLTSLYQSQPRIKQYITPSKYPSSTKDYSLTLKDKISISEVLSLFKAVPNLDQLLFVDEFLSEERRSITLRFILRSATKTLTDEDIKKTMGVIEQLIAQEPRVTILS